MRFGTRALTVTQEVTAHTFLCACLIYARGGQTLISRETSPLESAVVSVTKFHAGHAHNVIPAEVMRPHSQHRTRRGEPRPSSPGAGADYFFLLWSNFGGGCRRDVRPSRLA